VGEDVANGEDILAIRRERGPPVGEAVVVMKNTRVEEHRGR